MFSGLFFSLALLFDGLGLIAIGVGGRRIVSMVSEQLRKIRLDARRPGYGQSAQGPEENEQKQSATWHLSHT